MPRSRKGCNTCKRRHRKCDETKPNCRMCEAYGLQCEGYAITLRWDTDSVSPGRSSTSKRQGAKGVSDARQPQRRQSVATPDAGRAPRKQPRQGAELAPLAEASISDQHQGHGRGSINSLLEPVALPPLGEIQLPPYTALLAHQPSGRMAMSADSSTSMRLDLPSEGPGNAAQTFELVNRFMNDSVYTLYATTRDSPFPAQLNDLAQASETLRVIIAAMHLYLLNPNAPGPEFEKYNSQGMHIFRRQLDHYDGSLDAGILTAGLFICTLNLFQSLPWTPTLMHMINVFGIRGNTIPNLYDPLCHPVMRSTIEAMGVMDLPALVRGRTPRSFGIWKDIRAAQARFSNGDKSISGDVELISALPRTLLDLLARIEDVDAEDAFLAWPGEAGEIPLCHLWEAVRLAGILNCRRLHGAQPGAGSDRGKGANAPEAPGRPTNDAVVARIVAHIDAILTCSGRAEYSNYLTLNAIYFPYAAARLEVGVLVRHQYLMDHLCRIKKLVHTYGDTENERILDEMLNEAYEARNDCYDLDEECRRRGVEISLF